MYHGRCKGYSNAYKKHVVCWMGICHFSASQFSDVFTLASIWPSTSSRRHYWVYQPAGCWSCHGGIRILHLWEVFFNQCKITAIPCYCPTLCSRATIIGLATLFLKLAQSRVSSNERLLKHYQGERGCHGDRNDHCKVNKQASAPCLGGWCTPYPMSLDGEGFACWRYQYPWWMTRFYLVQAADGSHYFGDELLKEDVMTCRDLAMYPMPIYVL